MFEQTEPCWIQSRLWGWTWRARGCVPADENIGTLEAVCDGRMIRKRNNSLPTLCKLLDTVLLLSLYIQKCLTALETFLILNPDPSHRVC